MSFAPGYFTGTVEAKTLAGHPPVSRHWLCTPSRSRLGRTPIPRASDCMSRPALSRVHIEGQVPQCLAGGESIWLDAGRRHWHGAAPEQPMTHVAYQQAADDLSAIEWPEPVNPAT